MKIIRYSSLALILIAFTSLIYAKGGGDKNTRLNKSLGEPVYTKININNISTWIKNDGETDINQNGNSGFVFPKGSNKTAVFQSGFLWGGRVDGQWRVGGSTYRQGTVPGRILPNGKPANPKDPDVRIYRVRRDYKDGDLSAELADGDGPTIEAIRAQYEKDWNEWPANQGAPYEDVNGNGKYEPNIDIPGVPGADQTVWFVCNDLDPAQTDYMYGSLPMGIEEQVTVWGYKSTGALGNMIFRKFIIINKNPDKKPFTEMYVSMWSDIDDGDAGDDFAGCDTTLSLGYCYNANATDAVYNPLPPPAVGFDFFQGPMVPGEATDRAIFKGKYVEGKKNLPMTAFYFFINGDPVYSDPRLGIYETGALQWYNLFRGRISTSGDPFVDPTTGQPTKFCLSGDPVAGTGWLDGMLHPPGDRRIGLASGPFEMAYGDTQEVVVAQIAAGAVPGVDRLGAVQLLKFYDLQAQLAYDNFFNVPTAPPAPVVSVAELDREIVLSWGSDPAKVEATEKYSKGGFEFQGYCVYQLPSKTAQASEAKLIATYDKVDGVLKINDLEFDPASGVVQSKVVKFGTDSGVKRYISIKTDAFKGGLPLNNGSKYYFAVTAYAYNPDPNAVPRVLENAMNVIEVTPQTTKPGVRYEGSFGKEILGKRTKGKSDGKVIGLVVDPSRTTGGNYIIRFKDDGQGHGGVLWSLTKDGKVILDNQSNLSGDDNYLIVDGIQFKVIGPPPGVKHDDMFSTDDKSKWGWDIPSGSRRFTWAGGADGFHFEGFQGALGWASPRSIFGDGKMIVGPGEVKNVLLKLAKVNFTGDYDPPLDPNDPNVSYGYRYMRAAQRAAAKPEFAPFIINKENYGFQEFAKNVPLSAWDIEDPANPKRLAVGFLENNVEGGLVDGKYWPGNHNNYDNYATTGPREWLFIFDEPYSETPNPKLMTNILTSDARVMYWLTAARRGAAPFSPNGTGQDQFAIYPNKAITPADEFQLTAPSVTISTELAKEDVEKINVFPNPYYGVNPQEINKYQRFVTFTHLPQKATIRIFNLAGQLVRTIRKDSPDQFQRWDLNNESSLPVASGIYIVHIDMPDLGKTKILKVAIIQEQQVLDRF
ncbi:MAG: T9SS type A sorting domain-containing protein [Melioribacter sp.]|nr:T9SS type A sorting domain-containing protein [Melioribacter sp.]